MPDEFNFKTYKSIEDYMLSAEGTKYYHDLYLKAVNHPIRREILKYINDAKSVSKTELLKKLIENRILESESILDYNMYFLVKALCVEKFEKNDEIYYRITQAGKVIEYFKK